MLGAFIHVKNKIYLVDGFTCMLAVATKTVYGISLGVHLHTGVFIVMEGATALVVFYFYVVML
jgi:NaMN:DMB phosphoribosyltransferase